MSDDGQDMRASYSAEAGARRVVVCPRVVQEEAVLRQELELQLASHQQEFNQQKEVVMDLTKRICQMLLTARMELQRKAEAIATLERGAAQKRSKESGGTVAPAEPPHHAREHKSREEREASCHYGWRSNLGNLFL